MLMSAFDGASGDWQSVAPETAGFAADLASRLDQAVHDGRLPNLHAVVVARLGKLVLERYLEGIDERWGEPVGHRQVRSRRPT